MCSFMPAQNSDGELNQLHLKEEADMVCDDGRDTPSDLEEYVMVPAQFPSERFGITRMHSCPEQQRSDGLSSTVF